MVEGQRVLVRDLLVLALLVGVQEQVLQRVVGELP